MDQAELNEKLPAQSLPLQISIPLNWIVPESIDTKHATNLVIQQRGSEFILFFFELQPPLINGTPEEQAQEYQKLKSMDAVCVSRIVVSIESMQEMLQGMIGSINQFQEMVKRIREQSNDADTK